MTKKYLAFFMGLFCTQVLSAASVELTWNRHQDLDVTGYVVYYGKSPAFGDSMDVGMVERAQLDNLTGGTDYFMAVRAYDRSRNLGTLSSTLTFNTLTTGKTPGTGKAMLSPFRVSPNPFSNRVSVAYSINETFPFSPPAPGVQVLDVRGRVIKSDSFKKSGSKTFVFEWDGKSAFGKRMPKGVYFFKIQDQNKSHSKRIILY